MNIGATELRNNIYFLTYPSTPNTTFNMHYSSSSNLTINICNLWHNRFVTPPMKQFFISIKSFNYITCLKIFILVILNFMPNIKHNLFMITLKLLYHILVLSTLTYGVLSLPYPCYFIGTLWLLLMITTDYAGSIPWNLNLKHQT